MDVSGRVIDANTGQAVPNITVAASTPQYQSKYSNESTGVSDAEGYFTIKHLTTDFAAFPNYEKTTSFNLYIKNNNDYYGSTDKQVVKRSTRKAIQDIYVYCFSHLACTVNINSAISYSKGSVVVYEGEEIHFLDFNDTTSNKSFSSNWSTQTKVYTLLYDSSNQLVKSQADTIPAYTGPACGTLNYTINVN